MRRLEVHFYYYSFLSQAIDMQPNGHISEMFIRKLVFGWIAIPQINHHLIRIFLFFFFLEHTAPFKQQRKATN